IPHHVPPVLVRQPQRARGRPGRRRISCFFFNDTATTEIYTLSLHDALPIYLHHACVAMLAQSVAQRVRIAHGGRSEEHTSELQSHHDLVCRLLLEKKTT